MFLIKINLIMCHYYVSSILKYFLALLDKWLENFTCFGLLSDDDNYDFLPCDDIDGGERGPWWSYSDSGKVWGKKSAYFFTSNFFTPHFNLKMNGNGRGSKSPIILI